MLLKITEYCAWENEKWSYVIDMNKQEASAINHLMIFIRVANIQFEKDKEQSQAQPAVLPYHPLFNRYPRNLFAASRYSYEFYDSMEEKTAGRVTLIKSDGGLSLSGGSGYNSFTNIMTDRKISIAKMKSAMISMRDKKENKLYKVFDSIFLSKKLKPA
jgi:hypothetical protein